MSSSVGAQDVLEKLRSDAMRGKWSEVFKTCKQNRALYTTKITGTGDTVLHVALSNGQDKVVAKMLDFLVLEENNLTPIDLVFPVDGDVVESWSVNIVLGAENDRKNTLLHLAAVKGKFELCKKIGERDPSLIARRNIAGETPLLLAALYGRKKAFLWLHYLYMQSPGVSSTDLALWIRNDNDTILHCAIAEEHFDVAIEIVYLYKDHLKEMMRRNKEGLSPLHLLAAKPSAFKTTALLEQSILVHPIYWIWKVKEKKQATTHEELPKKTPKSLWSRSIKIIYETLENSLVKHFRFLRPFFLLYPLLLPFVPGILLVTVVSVLLWAFSNSVIYKMQKMKEKHTWSFQIMNELLYHCSEEDMSQIISRTPTEQFSISRQREEFNESESMATPLSGAITIDTPLMIAAKNGVVEMVERILELFPSRIKDVNAEGKNIVLLAVEYKQTEVFRFLCKQKWLSQSLFRQVDKEGNNALHLAANLGVDIDWLNPGEINWFEYVKNSMPCGLSERYNRKMKTPEDIFRESQMELMRSEGEWVGKTSQACSVVSTLVLSVSFTTRSNVPGGYDSKSGHPILRNQSAFYHYMFFSFVALFFSFISTIIFLSIVFSRSYSVPSWRSVTSKLSVGMHFMFFSIFCLWFSFFAADSSTDGGGLLDYILYSFLMFLVFVTQLPTFFGPLRSLILRIPARRHKTTRPIEYRKTKNNQDSTDLNNSN